MLRHSLTRTGGLSLLVVVVALASLTASCGGGGYAAKPMILMEFLYVDRALVPTAPTGTENLPRNAQLLLVFSEQVDPSSVGDQTIQIRYGPTGQSVPKGSFSVDENMVRFDPTVTAQGQPNPFGLDPVTQYLVDIPNYEEQPAVVRNLSDDPNLVTFFTTFTTSDGYLRELEPPEVVQVYSIPDRWVIHPQTGEWPANGVLAIEFSEAMDPSTFILGGFAGADENTGVDVRYDPFADITVNPDLIRGRPISGTFSHDAASKVFFFKPTFSFGTAKYEFILQVFQPLKDLSGNLLVNPRGFGPYKVDGTGIQDGLELLEEFDDKVNMDYLASDPVIEWGDPEEGVLRGSVIDSREAAIYGFSFQGEGPRDYGQYAAIISPFAGQALNQFISNISPPTSDGRRVMWAFSDTEMGPGGSITAASWGPDSNATYAAIYPTVVLRCGYKKDANSLSLAPSFAGNYDGSPKVVYTGSYQVPLQSNVGNTIDSGGDPGGYGENPGCQAGGTWNNPLWDYTGFWPWPEFSTFFEWTPGDPLVEGDVAFLFDASVEEGDTWQQVRGWFAATFPCSGILITAFPNRRMYSTFDGDEPDPPANFTAGILNPEPSVTDTSFTVTKRISIAQCLFYTTDSKSVGTTFGEDSDYLDVQLTPPVQSGGADLRIEFQGAQVVEADRSAPVGGFDVTPWTENVHDCDGFSCIRWRISMISNLVKNERAMLYSVNLPLVDKNN